MTLNKGMHPEAHRYQDRFLSPDLFQWQSQNQNAQKDKRGQLLRHHAERGVRVHLFIRKDGKIAGRAAPFIYCGSVKFVDWEGEKPITVRWSLPNAVPQQLRTVLGVP